MKYNCGKRLVHEPIAVTIVHGHEHTSVVYELFHGPIIVANKLVYGHITVAFFMDITLCQNVKIHVIFHGPYNVANNMKIYNLMLLNSVSCEDCVYVCGMCRCKQNLLMH